MAMVDKERILDWMRRRGATELAIKVMANEIDRHRDFFGENFTESERVRAKRQAAKQVIRRGR